MPRKAKAKPQNDHRALFTFTAANPEYSRWFACLEARLQARTTEVVEYAIAALAEMVDFEPPPPRNRVSLADRLKDRSEVTK